MKLSSFLTIVAVVAVLFGIAFIAAPVWALVQYGITADRYVAFMSRLFGLTLLTVGLIIWFARTVTDPIAKRAILIAGLVGDVIGFVVALQGQLSELTNALGWLTVLIYGLFAVGFACFLFGSQDRHRL
jgi:hypothetical protein